MCLGKSPLTLLSSAIGAQHRVKARVQGGTLFFLTMQMHVFLNAFLFLSSLIPLAALVCYEAVSPGNETQGERVNVFGQEDSQQACAKAVCGHCL